MKRLFVGVVLLGTVLSFAVLGACVGSDAAPLGTGTAAASDAGPLANAGDDGAVEAADETDASVGRDGGCVPEHATTNLLANGSFSRTTESWVTEGNASLALAPDGARGQDCLGTYGVVDNDAGAIGLLYPVDIPADVDAGDAGIEVEFGTYAQALDSNVTSVTVRLVDDDQHVYGPLIMGVYGPQWKRGAITRRVPAGARLNLRISSSDTGKFAVDAAWVTRK